MVKLRIKELRMTKGLTQQQLAQKANISQGFLSKLEKGVSRDVSPTLVVLESISIALDICIVDLIDINCSYCNTPISARKKCCYDTIVNTISRLEQYKEELEEE